MQKVTVVATLKAKEGKEQKVEQELLNMVNETRKETGCLNYDLHKSVDCPRTFIFYENWVSKQCLELHFQTPHLVRLRELQSELLDCAPDIKLLKMVSLPE